VTPVGTTGTPTGTVQFNDGGVSIGTATLASGVAAYSTTALGVGSHTINAIYLGGSNGFDPSASNNVTQQVNNAPPVITSLNPPGALPGGTDFTLTVNGTGFVNGDVVRWNGSNRTTTFVSNTQLQAAITAADVSVAGSFNVTVFDSSQSLISNTFIFAVDPNIVVTKLADSGPGSLRDAFTQVGSGGHITFAVTGTITLNSEIDIFTPCFVDGPGSSQLIIHGDGTTRLFGVNTTPVSFSGLSFDNGHASDAGGGGAMISFTNVVNIDNCVFSNNTVTGGGNAGGAIASYNGGTFNISNTTFINNTAPTSKGGAIYNQGSNAPIAALVITGSTFSQNSASRGGAIYNEAFSGAFDATVTVTNSTFSGNNSTGNNGAGAIVNTVSNFTAGDGTATINMASCTVADNTATGTGSASQILNRTNAQGTAVFNVRNTIISGATPTVVTIGTSSTITSQGNNLVSDSLTDFTASGDQVNTDPRLGVLRNNGGPTQTLALLGGSPAIDAGNNSGAPATDQRGITRPVNAIVDIGAFESLGHPWHNDLNPLDVVGSETVTPDGHVVAGDALAIINYINAFGPGPVPAHAALGQPFGFLDTADGSGDDVADNFVAANDVLAVINAINAGLGGEGENFAADMNAGSAGATNPQVYAGKSDDPTDLIALLALDMAQPNARRRYSLR